MNATDHIANELEGAGWPDEANAMRRGRAGLKTVIASLRDEHYPPDDLIEWLEEQSLDVEGGP